MQQTSIGTGVIVTSGRIERRLAAILAADVVGYSRLMGVDEIGTLTALKAARVEVVDPSIASHGGRIVKTTGDGLLVEFGSAVDAVTCAIEVQKAMAARQDRTPGAITFRMGINIGDVVIDKDDIFGDGVNIAARLESIADPGGLCISDDAFRQIRGRLDVPFNDGGYQDLKNIAEAVRIWRYGGEGKSSAAMGSGRAAGGIMREGPSIAVLPFNNMSSDPEQEYFADGMVEDIITALARYPSLFVIARNSSFAYKGKSPDIRAVGRDLGVRYVLEGSIRRGGQKVRINGQLIEADTGRHIWAEKYDGPLDDVFELQDRIVASVVGTIGPQIGEVEIARALTRPSSLSAYETLLRSKFAFRKVTAQGLNDAVTLAEEALTIDPGFAAAAVAAANARGYRVASGRSTDNAADIEACLGHARRALELDPFNVEAMAMAGRSLACFGEHRAGLELAEQACRDYPYSAIAWMEAGWANLYCAKPARAIECIEQAQALSPRDPTEHDRVGVIASALNQLGEYDRAISTARQSIRLNGNVPGHHRALITALALSGNIDQARGACEGLLAAEPSFRVGEWDARLRWVPEAKAASLKAFRLVGLPE